MLWQPWEFVIILGTSLGTFIVANPMKVIKDTAKAFGEAFKNKAPTSREYLDVLGLLYTLMRELRSKPRNEVEKHIDQPRGVGDLPEVRDRAREQEPDDLHLRLLPPDHHRQRAHA